MLPSSGKLMRPNFRKTKLSQILLYKGSIVGKNAENVGKQRLVGYLPNGHVEFGKKKVTEIREEKEETRKYLKKSW